MAVLRSLVTTLGLNAASFRSELARSKQDFSSFSDSIAAKGKAVVSGIGTVVDEVFSLRTALIAIGTGAALAGIKEVYASIDETAALGRNIGIAAQQWHAYAQAAEWVGSSGEKVADVIKDLNVKIADTAKAGGGSGPLADFFKQINQSAAEWAQLSPDEQFRKFTDELQRMSGSDARFWLDELNDSAAELFDTLYTNHGQLIDFADQINESGMALTNMQFAGVREAYLEINKLNTELGAVWNQVKASLAPAVSEGARLIQSWVTETAKAEGGFQNLGKTIALAVIDGVDKASRTVESFLNYTYQSLRKIQLMTGYGVDDNTRNAYISAQQDLFNARNAYNAANRDYENADAGDKDALISKLGELGNAYDLAEQAAASFLSDANAGDWSSYYQHLDELRNKINTAVSQNGDTTPALPAPSNGKTGVVDVSTNTKTQTDTALKHWQDYASALKNELSTQSRIVSDGLNESIYKEQAAYVKQQTELQKNLDAALKAVGGNVTQRQAVTSQHHDLMVMLQKQHEADMTRVQTEAEQNRLAVLKPLLDAETNYRNEFNKAKEINADPNNEGLITEKYAHQQRMIQLQQQFDEQKTQALGNQQVMSQLDESYRQAKESAEALHEQNITKIKADQLKKRQQDQMQAAQTYASFTQNNLSMITDMLSSSGKEQSKLMKVLLAAQKLLAIPSIIVSGQQAKAAAGAVAAMTGGLIGYETVQEVIDAQTAISVALVTGTAISGMAHDGIDNVPEEGTWLLDRNERVVDARTNADLKSFLAGNNGGASQPAIHQYFEITGTGDDNLIQAMQQAAEAGAKNGYALVLNDFKSRGTAHRLLFG